MGQSRVGDGALVLRKRQPAFPPGEMVSQPTQPRKVFLNHRFGGNHPQWNNWNIHLRRFEPGGS